MKPRDPTRWFETPELEGEFKAALREAVDPGPSAVQLRRLAERLSVSAQAPTASAVARARAPWPRRGLAGRAALLSAPLIVGVIVWWSLAGPPIKPRPAAKVVVERQVAAPAPALSPSSEAAPTRTTEAPAPDASRSLQQRRAGPRGHAGAPVASDPLAELALLRRARAALRSDPELALQLTERHRLEHGHGLLAEERELLAIEALLNLSRAGEARARAHAFEREFPGSAHMRRLHVLLSGVKP